MQQTNLKSAWYGVTILFLAWTVSFTDRIILSLLIIPIQRDLGINDTQISLLHGAAFAIFYTLMGIPIARLADRSARRPIIIVGMIVWNLASAACGLARDFWHLLVARIMVGVGEAALSPAAYSMIYDWFPKEKLGKAHAFYNSGVTVGAGLAFIIGGIVVGLTTGVDTLTLPVIGEIRSWQVVFFIAGLMGVPVILLMFTVTEPARRGGLPPPAPFSEIFRFALAQRGAVLGHLAGFALASLVFNSFLAWTPTFLVRVHGFSPGQAGPLLGIGLLVFGSAGMLTGGWISDKFMKAGHRDAHLRATLIACVGLVLAAALAPLAPLPSLTVVGLYLFFFFGAFPFGIGAAALQMITPAPMRAQYAAVYLLCINLAGIGTGPTVTALITDYVFGDPMAVGYSLALVGVIFSSLSALVFWLTLKPFSASALRLAEAESRAA